MISFKVEYRKGTEKEIISFKFGGIPEGTLDVYDSYLEFFSKSKAVGMMFGAIGSAIEGKGKTDFKLYQEDIKGYRKEGIRFWIDCADGDVVFVSVLGFSTKEKEAELENFLKRANQFSKPLPKVEPKSQPKVKPKVEKKEEPFSLHKEERSYFGETVKTDKPKSESLKKDSELDQMVEKLRVLKSLVDDGILTQEEFEAKKAQILGLSEKTHSKKEEKPTLSAEEIKQLLNKTAKSIVLSLEKEDYKSAIKMYRTIVQYIPTILYFNNGYMVDELLNYGLVMGKSFMYLGNVKNKKRHGNGVNIYMKKDYVEVADGHFIDDELYGMSIIEITRSESSSVPYQINTAYFFRNLYNGTITFDIHWNDGNRNVYFGKAVNGELQVINSLEGLKYCVAKENNRDLYYGFNDESALHGFGVTLGKE